MEIFPAIDLQNGKCVRLTQGDFNTAKIYEPDPVLQARKFADAGARWLHTVDLDGARAGAIQQLETIIALAAQVPLKIQVGGGIRDEQTIAALRDAGVSRVIIGSLAVKDPPLVRGWLDRFGPEHIVLAFDVKFSGEVPELLTHGWQSGSRQSLWDILETYKDSGLKHILCTDVGRDGMLAGSNDALYEMIGARFPAIEVLASGGVSGMDDLMNLAQLGLSGAIVGKAIYEGRLDLAEAITRLAHAG